jgi:sigma-B regulation protein RsbU (phosphoserine phosphatase)
MVTLRDVLLTGEVPVIPGLDVAVRARLRDDPSPIGEFVDVFELPGGLGIAYFGVAYGEVSGYDSHAGSFAVAAKYMLRGLAMRNPAPAWVASRLNDVMYRAFQQDRFLTLVYALYDPEKHALSLCNCGSWSPMLVRQGRAALLDHSGALLGAFEDQQYQQSETILTRGDLLVGYTDGLPEARRGKEILGIDRLRAELAGQEPGLSAEAVAENLLAAAERFAGGPLQDDAVVVAIRALE